MKNTYHNRGEEKNWKTMSIEELSEELNKILICEVEVSDNTVIDYIVSLIIERKLREKGKALKLSTDDKTDEIYNLFKTIERGASIGEVQNEAMSVYNGNIEAKKICQEIIERNKELFIPTRTDKEYKERTYVVLELFYMPIGAGGIRVRLLGIVWVENEEEAIFSVMKEMRERESTRDYKPTGYVTAVKIPDRLSYE